LKDLAAHLLERYERMKGKAKISEEAEFTGVNIRFAHPPGHPSDVLAKPVSILRKFLTPPFKAQ